jgi:hypothetical protein
MVSFTPRPLCLLLKRSTYPSEGARGSVLVKALGYKPEGLGFETR